MASNHYSSFPFAAVVEVPCNEPAVMPDLDNDEHLAEQEYLYEQRCLAANPVLRAVL